MIKNKTNAMRILDAAKIKYEIMEYVQDLFEDKMYISVKFESGKGQ